MMPIAEKIAALAKLQAFLDAAEAVQGSDKVAASDASPAAAARLAEALDARDWPQIERWFLRQSVGAGIDADTDISAIAAVLRATEHYKLVRFLLGQPAGRTMHQLGADYGLSYSHFRKLCREALGRGGKAEFQYWRNVRALLDMVDGGGSLTDIALRQGFASSSHFSDAMKGQFGIAPRYLTRALTIGKQ
ncbi:helix-turn-helix domain-containing protein [Oxalobacteraceae bacterium CAVE-383]|nr:helix-turn-helix domain-containing protein [Oxalobacteraceae bacterium CAVE-383]